MTHQETDAANIAQPSGRLESITTVAGKIHAQFRGHFERTSEILEEGKARAKDSVAVVTYSQIADSEQSEKARKWLQGEGEGLLLICDEAHTEEGATPAARPKLKG